MRARSEAFVRKHLLPDEIQEQLEREELLESLDRQGVFIARQWRASRAALGTSGVVRLLTGELVVIAPTALLVASTVRSGHWLASFWLPLIGLVWWSKNGRTSCLGGVGLAVASLTLSSLLASFDSAPSSLLGGLCVVWTYFVGTRIESTQSRAIVDRLANNPELYALLRANGSVTGPRIVDVHVIVRRSAQIESG